MRITIERTPELAHANGLPVRVWAGTTENGNPVMVLVTRVGSLNAAGARELAAEQLDEPPTRVVDPSGEVVTAPRNCTTCLAANIRRPATHVARDADGLEWFECGGHGPTDNVAETKRVALEQLGAWFDRACLPLPPGQAEAIEAWANKSDVAPVPHDVITAIVSDDRASDAAFVLNALRGAQVGWAHVAALAPSDEPAHAAWLAGFRMAAGAEPLGEARISQLASECRSLRARLEERREPTWLVKDFWALYSAAMAVTGNPTRPSRGDAVGWLELQVARLRPAFDVCESERQGAPDRLTPAERYALDGLHRWLHSPGSSGDCALIEAAQLYHDQVELIDATLCDRIEAEEQAAYNDPGISVPDDHEVARVARRVLVELPERPDRHRIIAAALALNARQPVPEVFVHRCHRTAALPGRVVRALVEHPRVSGPEIDFDGAVIFLAHAMRGAAVGWHARCAHPDEVPVIARVGAPIDEPHRAAWLTGYRIAADDRDSSETPAAGDVVEVVRIDPSSDVPMWEQANRPPTLMPASEVPPAVRERLDAGRAAWRAAQGFDGGEVALTDILRDHARNVLSYAAPETLTPGERALLAAVDAEEKARAESPDTWLGGER